MLDPARRPMSLVLFAQLADGLPHVLACAKSTDGCYVYCNRAFAVRAGRRRVADVIGRTARELFAPELIDQYDTQDEAILATGKPLQDHLELISVGADLATARWYVTSKSRLLFDDGTVYGLASLCVDAGPVDGMRDTAPHSEPADAMRDANSVIVDVVDYVRSHLREPIRVGNLARLAAMPPEQFESRVRRAFGLSPMQLIQRLRLEEAMHLLSSTTKPIGAIAAACGFYDQPSFVRQFGAATGTTPSTYRQLHGAHPSPRS